MATKRINSQKNIKKVISLEAIRGTKLKLCRNVHNKLYFLLPLLMCFCCYGNLKFIMRKVKVGLYCYLTAGILTVFYKCLLSSPPPSIKKLYKFLALKSGGYTGFALSFRHSVVLSFCHNSDKT